jgi:hypothetical protein
MTMMSVCSGSFRRSGLEGCVAPFEIVAPAASVSCVISAASVSTDRNSMDVVGFSNCCSELELCDVSNGRWAELSASHAVFYAHITSHHNCSVIAQSRW